MFRFRPTVEALSDRALPSAVIAGPDAPVLPAQAAQVADEAVASHAGDQAEAGKVSMQDFHFTGKVSMQDFNFVMKMSKASPTL